LEEEDGTRVILAKQNFEMGFSVISFRETTTRAWTPEEIRAIESKLDMMRSSEERKTLARNCKSDEAHTGMDATGNNRKINIFRDKGRL